MKPNYPLALLPFALTCNPYSSQTIPEHFECELTIAVGLGRIASMNRFVVSAVDFINAITNSNGICSDKCAGRTTRAVASISPSRANLEPGLSDTRSYYPVDTDCHVNIVRSG